MRQHLQTIRRTTDSTKVTEDTSTDTPDVAPAVTGGVEINYTFAEEYLAMDLTVDDDSYLELHLKDGVTYEGMITVNATGEDTDEASEDEYDVVYVIVDEGCIWSLTGDSVISEIELNGTIEFNGFTVTLADGTVLSEEIDEP